MEQASFTSETCFLRRKKQLFSGAPAEIQINEKGRMCFMSKSTTKRSLLVSVLALVMCVAMLVGTTFAWFTDSASTSVNKIEAGKLDIDVYYANTADGGEGSTWTKLDNNSAPLSFLRKDGEKLVQDKNILWEPNCTYSLPALKIVNNGNLALKYKVLITGIKGDSELNNVIEWTMKLDNEEFKLGSEHYLLPQANSEGFDILTIQGHMDANADNYYQGMTIEGIGITVYAAQYTYENDSNDNKYDENATYYPVLDAAGMQDALTNGGNIKVDADVDPSDTLVATKDTTIDMNGKTIANTENVWKDNTNMWSLVSAREGAKLTISGNGTFKAKENDCFAVDVQDGSVVTIENGTFVGNIHAVYVEEGTANIKGGFYSVQQKYPDANKANEFVLNCYDANRAAGKAKIIVTGGTFVNFNPADCKAEGEGTNFVAEGYSVIKEVQTNGDIWYTVVKGTGVLPGTQEELNEGIKNSDKKDVTVVMPKDSTFTLDNDIANEGSKSRDITFVGDGTQTVDVAKNAVAAEGGKLNYQRGSTFTFENVTITAGTNGYEGVVCDKLILKNCTIKGFMTTYSDMLCENCVFERDGKGYLIDFYGGKNFEMNNCQFKGLDKNVYVYVEGMKNDINVVFNDCTFSISTTGDVKSSVMLNAPRTYNGYTYNVTFNRCSQTGGNTTVADNVAGKTNYQGIYGLKHKDPYGNGLLIKGTVTIDGKVVYKG